MNRDRDVDLTSNNTPFVDRPASQDGLTASQGEEAAALQLERPPTYYSRLKLSRERITPDLFMAIFRDELAAYLSEIFIYPAARSSIFGLDKEEGRIVSCFKTKSAKFCYENGGKDRSLATALSLTSAMHQMPTLTQWPPLKLMLRLLLLMQLLML